MYQMVRLLAFILLTSFCCGQTTTARLLIETPTAAEGETVWVGIQLSSSDGWHTYWRTPGDDGDGGKVGQATRIDWTLPAGISAGEIQWPVPHKSQEKDFHTHSYSGETTLLVPLQISTNATRGPAKVQARVRWLECKEECVPGQTNLSLSIAIGERAIASTPNSAIEKTRMALPKRNPSIKLHVASVPTENPDVRDLIFTPPQDEAVSDFLPYESSKFLIGAKTESLPNNGDQRSFKKRIFKTSGEFPIKIIGLATTQQEKSLGEVELSVMHGETPLTASQETSTTLSNSKEPLTFGTLWLKLASAFLGGLILNIMPCVLPVLALKVLGFVNQAKTKPARVRQLGIIYGLGVLFSFVVLATVAVLVQRAGGIASWSAPLQNPQVRVLVTVLITLVALNLFGVFEVTLEQKTNETAHFLASKEGPAGAFFNGVLASVLATPCTAPFLASAIAFAFTQPPWVILLCFLSVGAGLAAPFVLLCWEPSWLKYLPRPGNWMVNFKMAMGFPLLATAIWLFWLTSKRMGEDGVLWFGLFLVIMSCAFWIWGRFVQLATERRGLAMATSLLLLVGGYYVCMERQLEWRVPLAKKSAPKLEWAPWSASAVIEARKQGKPVLVDFTADSCLNCKWNKKFAIEVSSTIETIKAAQMALFEGDFTDADPVIAAELQKHGRRGVPLVLVYPPDLSQPPAVLPVALTPGIVQSAIKLARP